jgi:hypothetical protein
MRKPASRPEQKVRKIQDGEKRSGPPVLSVGFRFLKPNKD